MYISIYRPSLMFSMTPFLSSLLSLWTGLVSWVLREGERGRIIIAIIIIIIIIIIITVVVFSLTGACVGQHVILECVTQALP